jgi:hypothetical protein
VRGDLGKLRSTPEHGFLRRKNFRGGTDISEDGNIPRENSGPRAGVKT